MKRTAYTIVELVIAMTIGMILLAIGIPRYNQNIQRQEFTEEASALHECVRRAQDSARLPSSNSTYTGSDMRYSVAYITTEEKSFESDTLTRFYPSAVQCRNYLFPGSYTLKNLAIDDSVDSSGNPTNTADVPIADSGELSLYWLTYDNIPDVDNADMLHTIIRLHESSSTDEYPGKGINTRKFLMIFDKYRGGKLVAVKSNESITSSEIPYESAGSDSSFYYMDPLGLSAELFVAEMQLNSGMDFNPVGASTATITIPYSGGLSEMKIQSAVQKLVQ